MKAVEYYAGREQTYLKHFFLERYLERVAYNIGSFADRFVYVDGFSGPWRSENEDFEDTSFVIAIKKLREVIEGLSQIGRRPAVRCLFIEADAERFAALESAVGDVTDLTVCSLNGDFEHIIPDVLKFVGDDFALTFIDPTGWTGFGLHRIAPLLRHRGEVIVNFMFDHINRFLDHPEPEVAATFDELFGGPGWADAVEAGPRREERIVDLYRERLRGAGSFDHVTSTRVLKPTSDRAYFYLVYGTRHPKGLLEFRNVERKAVEEQERVRLEAKQQHRVARSSQTELFGAADIGGTSPYQSEKNLRLDAARDLLRELMSDRAKISYEDARAAVLELPLVWEPDLKDLILKLRSGGEVEIEGMTARQRRPQPGHILRRPRIPR